MLKELFVGTEVVGSTVQLSWVSSSNVNQYTLYESQRSKIENIENLNLSNFRFSDACVVKYCYDYYVYKLVNAGTKREYDRACYYIDRITKLVNSTDRHSALLEIYVMKEEILHPFEKM